MILNFFVKIEHQSSQTASVYSMHLVQWDINTIIFKSCTVFPQTIHQHPHSVVTCRVLVTDAGHIPHLPVLLLGLPKSLFKCSPKGSTAVWLLWVNTIEILHSFKKIQKRIKQNYCMDTITSKHYSFEFNWCCCAFTHFIDRSITAVLRVCYI